MLNWNTWNHFPVCKEMINVKIELLVIDSKNWDRLTVYK